MIAFSSACLAVANADRSGAMRFVERQGSFGPYVAICDSQGTIEVHNTIAEAIDRVREIRGRVAK